MNQFGRIPVIGGIAHYNAIGLPEGPDRTPLADAHHPGQAAHRCAA